MTATGPATPLVALAAVVVDTETTGLDPTRARIVQIGAVVIAAGAVVQGETFDSLVDPGEPIPPATTAVHHITDAAVMGAPKFPEAYAAFGVFAGGRPLIGHNIGFDLAMLRRELGLAGQPWQPPRTLDTRLLGEICFPDIAGFTLEKLAARLSIDIVDRHDALADARLTAQVFLGLVPHLRARGVRTFGEAEEACRRLTTVLEGFHRVGWVEPVAPPAAPAALARIDAFPYRHRVRDVMAREPVSVPPTTSLRDAIATMTSRRISSVFVVEGGDVPAIASAGIVTERDVLRAIGVHGAAALDMTVGPLASRPLAAVGADDFVYRAIGRMDGRRIRHLAVGDAAGRIVGALSARDLLRLRASDALALGDAVEMAEGVPALAAAWARMPEVARRLVDEGVPARDVAAVVSDEMGVMTRRAAETAEARLREDGHGPPPTRYAVLVLGSAGRGESLLAPDQDNAVLWADCDDETAADAWFARHGAIMADVLNETGIPYCKGGVMAKTPDFRGSLSTWRARMGSWVERTRPQDLLNVDIFFDFRCVAGDVALAETLRTQAHAAARGAPVLAKLLAASLETFQPPLGLFGNFKTENGRMDLKKGGLFPVVAAARCLALRHGVTARSTPERIAALRAAKIGADQDLDAFDRAHASLLAALLRQQVADIASGRPPTNLVDPTILSKRESATLKRALGALSNIATTVRDLLFTT